MTKMNIEKIVRDLIDTFLDAGEISINLRNSGLTKKIKSDNTPVSNGDLEVNEILTKKILKLTAKIPIVSEETSENKSRNNLENFWLIDPIDGTNDYINNREEFTLNAALILDKIPAIGIIYAPSKKRLFFSYGHSNSYEFSNDKEVKLIDKKKVNNNVKAVSYSEKLKPDILKFHQKFNVKSFDKMKSSLKFCVVATGEFDLYIAEARACEWDIAAGHAIVEHAGGKITDFEGNKILYGKPNFKNQSLIVKGKNIL